MLYALASRSILHSSLYSASPHTPSLPPSLLSSFLTPGFILLSTFSAPFTGKTSISNVTGPSLTRATSIIAWNTPSLTLVGSYRLCTLLTNSWYSVRAVSPPAAPWKSGLFPFFVEASRVNCETGWSQKSDKRNLTGDNGYYAEEERR